MEIQLTKKIENFEVQLKRMWKFGGRINTKIEKKIKRSLGTSQLFVNDLGDVKS